MYNHRFLALFLISLFICLFVSDSHAITNSCPRHKVKTELKAKKAKTKFLSGSLTGINDYLNSHSVLAFVQNPISIKSFYDFDVKEIGHGRYCVVLKKVKVQYRSSPRIVMPSNFKKKSCEYKIIRKHEQRHLDVHYDYFKRSKKQYEAFLGRVARNVPIFEPFTSSARAEQIKQEIANYFDEQFYTKVNSSIKEMQYLQGKIDSPQEYTFTGRKIDRCKEMEERKQNKNKKTFYDYNED